jgi:hypothetical protein
MRRRRNADAPSDTPITPTTEAVQAASESNETTEPTVESPPKRRRSSPRRKTEETPTDPVGEPAPIDLVAPPPAEPVTASEAPLTEPTEEPTAKPKRAPRRRAATKAEAEPAVIEAVVAEPVAELAPVPVIEAVAETVAAIAEGETETGGDRKPSRRRRSRRGKTDAATEGGEETIAESPVVEVAAPVAEATDAPVAPTDPAVEDLKSRRTRGLRRQTAPSAHPSLVPPVVSPPVTDAPAETGEAAEGGPAAEPATPRRTRGLRRAPRPAVAPPTPTGAPAVAAPPPPPIYQPLPAETLARLAETKVAIRKNVPELVINGEARIPLWFFVNTEDPEAHDVAVRQIRLAYEAGVRFFTLLAHLPWKTRSGERRYDLLEESLQLVAENAPDAFVLPRLIFSPPVSWVRTHENDMARYPDGEVGDVSIASRAFWEGEAEDALRAAVEHVAQGPHAGRVFGFYLEHGEWFYEKGRGYDLSEANTTGFRDWLRARYRNSQIALRAAWCDGKVTFDTAEVPTYPPPTGPTLFFSNREQRWADFHEYASDIVAQVIVRLGKAVKEASGGRSAVAVSYGYTLELPRAHSGHLALGQVLASPNVDILTGPISYSARMPGGSAPLPVPVDSIHLAGKLWVSEDDTKTYLSGDETPDSYNPKVNSTEGTWAAHSRNFGAALTRGAGISYMDLWGTGWLDDRTLWNGIGRLREIAEQIATRRRNPRTKPAPEPDVAVIVDERSFFDVRADESLLGHLVSQQRDTLVRSGARIGFYLLSDLTKKNFPETPRLLLFLNAFHLPDAVRTAIKERFQNDGRTLAWVYGPGNREENLSELTDTIGIQLRLQPWGSKTGTHVLSNSRSPLTDALRGQKFGEEQRLNPSFAVVDPKAKSLGEYTATGNPSLAYRKHARWQSVFIGEPTLPLPLLRGLFRLAGVPVTTVDDDVAWTGDNLLCLHSAPGGGTTVYLPEEGALMDLLTGETLASDGFGARLSMPPRGTRLLFYGTAAEIARFGGDVKMAPPGLTESELPTALPVFEFEEAEPIARMPALSAEDEALLAASLEMPIPDKDEGEDAEIVPDVPAVAAPATVMESVLTVETGAGKKKRRRRRRGRGRGSAETDEEGLLSEAADEDAEDETEEGEETAEGEVAAPRRPSLEELLPLSEALVDSELPPIPEEFLPLDPLALTAAPAEVVEEEGTTSRRRRPRSTGRSRRRGAEEATPELAFETANEGVVGTESVATVEEVGSAEEAIVSPEASAPSDEDAESA